MRERKNANDEGFWIIKNINSQNISDSDVKYFLLSSRGWWWRRHDWEKIMKILPKIILKWIFSNLQTFSTHTSCVLLIKFFERPILYGSEVRSGKGQSWGSLRHALDYEIFIKWALKNSKASASSSLVIEKYTSFNLWVHWASVCKRRTHLNSNFSHMETFLICLFTCEKRLASVDSLFTFT